jgi:uncharacterized membrane protein YdjX (TVP38/TMEM64 family)
MPGCTGEPTLRDRSGNAVKLLAFLLLVAAGVYCVFFTPTGELFRTPAGRRLLIEHLNGLVLWAGPLGPVVFILVYALAVLFVPATPFTIAGAVIFGKFYGMIYNLAADTLGASLSFFLGRYFLHGMARGFLQTRLPWLDRKTAQEGFSVVFYLRIFWFPFIVLNYAAGATRIRFRDYFLGTFLGLLAPVFLFTYFVGALRDILATYRGPADLLTYQVILPVLLLLLSLFLPTILNRFRTRRSGSRGNGRDSS